MPEFWISFRIADETINGQSYEDRYDALVGEIHSLGDMMWAETTSFIAFRSPKDSITIASRLTDHIEPSRDLFILRQLDAKSAYICGDNDDPDIFKLMPYLKKLG